MTTTVEEPPVRLTLTEPEAATYLAAKTGLKFSKHMVQKRRQDGRLAGRLMDGRRVVYLKADLDEYLNKNLALAADAAGGPA